MEGKFKVKVGETEISWENGSFECDNQEVLDWLREKCELVSKTGQGVELDGSTVCSCYGASPEKAYITAFAAIQTFFGGSEEMIEGHRPTWEEDLGYTPSENAVT